MQIEIVPVATHTDPEGRPLTLYRHHGYVGEWYSVGFANDHGERVFTMLLTGDEAEARLRELRGCEGCRTRGPVEPVETEFQLLWLCGGCRDFRDRREEDAEALREWRVNSWN